MSSEIPATFDSILSIEGEPSDTLVGSQLVEHVRLEAFASDRDEPGNYILQVKTRLPADLTERGRVASQLGIDIRDSAVPHLPNQFSEPVISRVGFELRNSILLRPRPATDPTIRGIAHTFGIDTRWHRKDREHVLSVRFSVGATAISQVLHRAGLTNLQPHEAPDTQYETEELVRAIESGKMLVCKRPGSGTNSDAMTAFVWPLHDNVFHLYSNALLQTPEFNEFVRTHGANRKPGHLDGYLGSAGATLHRMSGQDWYDRPTATQAPYRQFRHFLYSFIDPQSSGGIRLGEELAAMTKVDEIVAQDGEMNEATELLLQESRATMDRPGNMLDQLNPVVRSIIARFVRLTVNRDEA